MAVGHVARGGDIGELCFRAALSSRRTGRWLRSSHVRPRLLSAGAPCLHGGGQVPRERSRHPLGFRDVRLPGGREYPATAPGSFRILLFLKKKKPAAIVFCSCPPLPHPPLSIFFPKTIYTRYIYLVLPLEGMNRGQRGPVLARPARHPCSNRPGFFSEFDFYHRVNFILPVQTRGQKWLISFSDDVPTSLSIAKQFLLFELVVRAYIAIVFSLAKKF